MIDIMRAVPLDQIARRKEVEDFIADRSGQPEIGAFLAQSLDLETKPPKWTLNLETLATEMPEIMGFPTGKETHSGLTLFLTGGASDYVQDHDHSRAKSLFPNTRFKTLEGAGHWLHAEKPRPFLAEVDAFLNLPE